MEALPTELRLRLRALLRRAGLSTVPEPVLGMVGAVCLAAVLFAAWQWWPRSANGTDSAVVRQTKAASAAADSVQKAPSGGVSEASEPTATGSAWVHVVGAVRRPGV